MIRYYCGSPVEVLYWPLSNRASMAHIGFVSTSVLESKDGVSVYFRMHGLLDMGRQKMGANTPTQT